MYPLKQFLYYSTHHRDASTTLLVSSGNSFSSFPMKRDAKYPLSSASLYFWRYTRWWPPFPRFLIVIQYAVVRHIVEAVDYAGPADGSLQHLADVYPYISAFSALLDGSEVPEGEYLVGFEEHLET